jgi:exopolyphosphatase/pppGpp-phosphohydrolase
MDEDFNVNPANKLDVDEQSVENLSPEPLSLEAIFHRYGIERSHAGNVARNAVELFDILDPIHGLDPEMRKFVEVAALVHDTGVAKNLENHHKAGRTILRLHPPVELSEKLWPVVAWTTFLHKKKIRKEKLEELDRKSFGKMAKDLQDLTLKAASIIRLADALDYSRMKSRIGTVKFGRMNVMFQIEGLGSAIDAERMNQKGDLWHLLYTTKLEFRSV